MVLNLMYRKIKRLTDMILASALLILLSPVMLAAALLVKAERRGRVIFVHERVGYMGRTIGVYKFRSMVEGAENLEEMLNDEELEEYYREYRIENDPRITPLGRFLRRSSIDELPQLVNVIKGDMSLIGPRPLVPKEYENYTEEEKTRLTSVKPGISGYWQVHGRGHATYENGLRQKQELFYADNASLLLDAKLIVLTVFICIRGFIRNDYN